MLSIHVHHLHVYSLLSALQHHRYERTKGARHQLHVEELLSKVAHIMLVAQAVAAASVHNLYSECSHAVDV